jgi:YVTN family beta-propeller protein
MRARAILTLTLAALAGLTFAQEAAAAEIVVASRGSDDVTIVDTETGAKATVDLPAGSDPQNVAILPDGRRAYVAASQGSVFVIDLETNAVVGNPIDIGFSLAGIAAAPDGERVYVVRRVGATGELYAIDTASDQRVGTPIGLGKDPSNLAITPGGARAYVNTSPSGGAVEVIDLATQAIAGPPIPVGGTPRGITVHPDGSRIYSVSNSENDTYIIDTAANSVTGKIVSSTNHWLAITPDGARGVGVFGGASDNVQASDLTTNQPVGERATVAGFLDALAIEPDGSRVWLNVDAIGSTTDTITPLDTRTLAPAGEPVVVGSDPFGLAIVPNQPPEPVIEATMKGRKLEVDAGDSRDESLATNAVAWSFGDGATADTAAASHIYARPGRHTVALTLDDGQGCTGFVFTGQTAMCNGPSVATAETVVAAIKLGKLKRNRAKGTARLKVKAPGPGKLKLSGNGVRKSSAKVKAGKGGAKLVIKARGGKRRKLERSGKAKLKLEVTYRPEGGLPNELKKRAKLVRR